jgi:hypothetical protein
MVNHKERDMAKRICALGVLTLLLAIQSQADAKGNGIDPDVCPLLAGTINTSVLYSAAENLTYTVLRENQTRLPNGAMTVSGPANCNYTTTIEEIAASRIFRGEPPHSGLMTYL